MFIHIYIYIYTYIYIYVSFSYIVYSYRSSLLCYMSSDMHGFWLLGAEGARHWPGLCRSLGKEQWMSDPRFKDGPSRTKNQVELVRLMDEAFAAQPLAHWASAFKKEDVWWQKVLEAQEAAEPQNNLHASM